MAGGFAVELEGEDALYAALDTKSREILQRLVEKVNQIDNELADKIRLNLTDYLQVRTGKGLASVEVEDALIEGSVITGGVRVGGEEAPYLRIQELGSDSPYTIVPVNKKYLAFMIDGKQIFTKMVRHPPIKATHFMQSAVDDMGDIEARLNEALED